MAQSTRVLERFVTTFKQIPYCAITRHRKLVAHFRLFSDHNKSFYFRNSHVELTMTMNCFKEAHCYHLECVC